MYFDFLVVGGGAAGMAAAIEAAEHGASVLLAEREQTLGGVLNQCIHHGFGLAVFHRDMTGVEYAGTFADAVRKLPITVLTESTVLKLQNDKTALIANRHGLCSVRFGQCILATGCRERTLGSQLVGGTRPSGIYTAGQAQYLINIKHYDIGDRFVILGSGNVGQIMARRLSLLGKQVAALIEQKDRLGGSAKNRRDCVERYRIPVILNAEVDRIEGEARITGVQLSHSDTGETVHIGCDTLITALGLIPDRELVRGEIPPWLGLCGNCESVHDIVDTVTVQAKRLVRERLKRGETDC